MVANDSYMTTIVLIFEIALVLKMFESHNHGWKNREDGRLRPGHMFAGNLQNGNMFMMSLCQLTIVGSGKYR